MHYERYLKKKKKKHVTSFTVICHTNVHLKSFSDLFSYLCHVTSREHVKVLLESTSCHHLSVPFVIERLTPDDVVPQGGILEPRLLGHICHAALQT